MYVSEYVNGYVYVEYVYLYLLLLILFCCLCSKFFLEPRTNKSDSLSNVAGTVGMVEELLTLY